jgi:hypothetical protein
MGADRELCALPVAPCLSLLTRPRRVPEVHDELPSHACRVCARVDGGKGLESHPSQDTDVALWGTFGGPPRAERVLGGVPPTLTGSPSGAVERV